MALTAKQKREAREQSLRNEASAAIQQTNQAAILDPGSVADAQGAVAKPRSAGAKVIVACKLGVAYFDIQLCKEEEVYENTQTGPRLIKQMKRVGNVVRLRGTAYPRGTPPEGFPERPKMAAGAALNFGIDKDFFDEWMRQNRLNPVVMNKMIFAHESEDHVVGEARELSKFLSGLEPINPKSDVRMPKSTRADVSNIETEESRAKKTAGAEG